ncbi:LysR substrate-binding domain-containing protein [Marinobacterium jannaschii]|uniref:LysR substrate-binding domain-containing protein n=1 Tax=Marinobacterium jannaschii TaxID=64970 RepID=UPI0004829727|nr:LysR substrate-binding domain-containing protein [Marinobacterium jannaschii]
MATQKLPPLNWLKTFEAAARLLNFSAAARELNMTQSAVSQQIRLLEDCLDQPLFNRLPRRLSLTNNGRAYLPVVQEALHHLQRGTADIFSPLKEGKLTIQANTAFVVLWLAPRLKRFSSLYPSISVQIVNANWDSEFTAMPADLAIRHGLGSWPGLSNHRLVKPRMRPFCSPRVAERLSTGSDLLHQPLIEIMGNHENWNDWFSSLGIEVIDRGIRHQVDSAAIAVNMAANDFGVCLSYDSLMEGMVREGKLIAPFDAYMQTVDSFYLSYRQEYPLAKSAAVFRDWLLEDMEQVVID